ncbi:DUF3027 domain-containing protein [Agrococcus jejuensis]|uniref:DUF3027 domain-containing protein n=1 Tax=Agrococcus jejuensis TaxID=399736 RepID=A0A1G8B9P4_9MICO|nr:DUF3027 domain-containing protein [Agrococcus jejuensis]SDH29959.1 Protein of unknown function [Agrococcus jejuensis]
MTTVPSAEALRLAESALDEVAPAGAVGEVVDAIDEQGVLALRYRSQLGGYPDWLWTVTLATDDEGAQTVLEVALLPGEGSLVAPEWVPWADRLADYLAAKESAAADDEDEDGDDASDDDEDDDDSDESDDDHGFDDFDEADLASDDDADDGLDVDDHGDASHDDADDETAGR